MGKFRCHIPSALTSVALQVTKSPFESAAIPTQVLQHRSCPLIPVFLLSSTALPLLQAKLLQYVSQDLLEAALSCRKADAPFDMAKYEARMTFSANRQ